ncbi:unnamed protein product, partial [Coregonus sp. 'balchen']
MSDPDEAAVNNRRKRRLDYDRQFRIKPLMNNIRRACLSNFHPRRNLSIHEWIVPSKAKKGLLAESKSKHTKRDFKMFVLTDSNNGYTMDYVVYKKLTAQLCGVPLSEVHPSKTRKSRHTPVTIARVRRDGSEENKRMPCQQCKNSGNEDIRSSQWWRNACQVPLCVGIRDRNCFYQWHKQVRHKADSWSCTSIPVPMPDIHKESVNSSDHLIQYFSGQQETIRGYNSLFYHFVDMETTNSHAIHTELCKDGTVPMTHQAFIEELTTQLCG